MTPYAQSQVWARLTYTVASVAFAAFAYALITEGRPGWAGAFLVGAGVWLLFAGTT